MFNNVNTHRCFIMTMMYIRNLVDLHLKYYADHHDVDEDMRAITAQGGDWGDDIRVGVVRRTMNDAPTRVSGDVAYKYNKNSTLITGVEFYMNCSNLWICQITEE